MGFQGQFPNQWQPPVPQGAWQPGQPQNQPKQTGGKKKQSKEKSKNEESLSLKSSDGQSSKANSIDSDSVASEKGCGYAEVVCYNCGEPGHHKAACILPKTCFICRSLEHEVDGCPVRNQPQMLAKFIGSAASGLGFYHIELPFQQSDMPAVQNVGLVYVDEGEVSKEELSQGFATIYKTNWPWQIRQPDDWNFLVKFPPHLKVEEIVGYPSFGLPKKGVFVKVHVWNGELDFFAELQEVWVQIRGLNPLWCRWNVLLQLVTAFGLLVDVDWVGMFKCFFETVKIKCRDSSKIPASRIFEVQDHLYQIFFEVENPTRAVSSTVGEVDVHPPPPGDQDGQGEEKKNGDMITDKAKDSQKIKGPSLAGQLSGGTVGSSSSEAHKTRAAANLSEKVREIASAYISKRDPVNLGPSLLSPLKDFVSSDDKVIDWIIGNESSCANLLQQMELANEEEAFLATSDDTYMVSKDDSNHGKVAHVQQGNQKQKWGPVCSTKQSVRCGQNKGKSVMEMAQEITKRKNLEGPVPAAVKLKGLAFDPSNGEEMEAGLQRAHASPGRCFLHPDRSAGEGATYDNKWLIPEDCDPHLKQKSRQGKAPGLLLLLLWSWPLFRRRDPVGWMERPEKGH